MTKNRGLEFDHNSCCAHDHFYSQGRVKRPTAYVRWSQDVCDRCRRLILLDRGMPPWRLSLALGPGAPPWIRELVRQRRAERDALRRGSAPFGETPPETEEDGTDMFVDMPEQDEALTEMVVASSRDQWGVGQASVHDAFADPAAGLIESESDREAVTALMSMGTAIRASNLEHAAAIARWFRGSDWAAMAEWYNTAAPRVGLRPLTTRQLKDAVYRWDQKVRKARLSVDDFRS